MGQTGSAIAFFVAQVIFFLCYSLASISYVSWLTEKVFTAQDRTIVSAARMLLGGLAALIVAGAMPVISAMASQGGASQGGAGSYTLASALFAAVACAILLGSLRGTDDRADEHPAVLAAATPFARSDLGRIFGNRAFLLFNLAGVGVGIFGTSIARSAPSYFTVALGSAGLGSALAIMTAAGVGSVPVWAAIGIRTGRRSNWAAAAALGLVVAAGFAIAAPLSATLAVGVFALLTIASAGAHVNLWALLPDLADDVRRATHQPLPAICGSTAFCQKMAVAIGTLLLGASGGIGHSGAETAAGHPTLAISSVGFLYPAMVGMVVTLGALAVYSRVTRR